jgi:hypothetical protein
MNGPECPHPFAYDADSRPVVIAVRVRNGLDPETLKLRPTIREFLPEHPRVFAP